MIIVEEEISEPVRRLKNPLDVWKNRVGCFVTGRMQLAILVAVHLPWYHDGVRPKEVTRRESEFLTPPRIGNIICKYARLERLGADIHGRTVVQVCHRQCAEEFDAGEHLQV